MKKFVVTDTLQFDTYEADDISVNSCGTLVLYKYGTSGEGYATKSASRGWAAGNWISFERIEDGE